MANEDRQIENSKVKLMTSSSVIGENDFHNHSLINTLVEAVELHHQHLMTRDDIDAAKPTETTLDQTALSMASNNLLAENHQAPSYGLIPLHEATTAAPVSIPFQTWKQGVSSTIHTQPIILQQPKLVSTHVQPSAVIPIPFQQPQTYHPQLVFIQQQHQQHQQMTMAIKYLQERVCRLETAITQQSNKRPSSSVTVKHDFQQPHEGTRTKRRAMITRISDPDVVTKNGNYQMRSADLDTQLRPWLLDVCVPVMMQNPNPDNQILNTLVNSLIERIQSSNPAIFFNNPQLLSKTMLLSVVRRWFRKKREHMTTRLFAACDRLLPSTNLLSMTCESDLTKSILTVDTDPDLWKRVFVESGIQPFATDLVGMRFAREKMASYLKSKYERNHFKTMIEHQIRERRQSNVDGVGGDSISTKTSSISSPSPSGAAPQ